MPVVIGVLGVGGATSDYGADQQRYKATHDHFRAAMAAPANLPEFKGNVAAVLTEKYWDRELSAAKAKEQAIRRDAAKRASAQALKPAEAKRDLENALANGLTERERTVLEKGISNLEFHYLGSAKILGGIGRGLAEAMQALKKPAH
jgi:alpha-galactosidase